MPIIPDDSLNLAYTPKWNEGKGASKGTWYVSQTPPPPGKAWQMYRHKPNIHLICEPLMGKSIRDACGKIRGVAYPSLARRLKIYREALEIATVFQHVYPLDFKQDIFNISVYRRNVTRFVGVKMDVLLYQLALDAHLSKSEWGDLRARMPNRSWIKEACTW